MKDRYSWKNLIGEPQLCEGGRLASIVFCCDPRKKECPILNMALKILGISKRKFVEVMEKHRISVPEKDGTCFGNLAFCPGLEKESRDRDEFLIRKHWSLSKYLKYKFKILRELVPEEKLDLAFSTRIIRQYAVKLLDLETRKEYKAFAIGNVKYKIMTLTEVFDEESLSDKNVETLLSGTEYVGVRIPHDLVRKLDELVDRGVVSSRSDGIRRALQLYLSSLPAHVKQIIDVKP